MSKYGNSNIRNSEYVAENLDKCINYSEYLAENLDTINYSKYLAEQLDKKIDFSEYTYDPIGQQHKNVYSDYIAKYVNKPVNWKDYLEGKKEEKDDFETQNYEEWVEE